MGEQVYSTGRLNIQVYMVLEINYQTKSPILCTKGLSNTLDTSAIVVP